MATHRVAQVTTSVNNPRWDSTANSDALKMADAPPLPPTVQKWSPNVVVTSDACVADNLSEPEFKVPTH